MSGLFSREASFLLNDDGNDRAGTLNFNLNVTRRITCQIGSSRSRGNGTQRYGGRSRRGGRGRGNYSNRGGGRNSGRSYFDRDVPDDDDGLGHEGSWSGREQRKLYVTYCNQILIKLIIGFFYHLVHLIEPLIGGHFEEEVTIADRLIKVAVVSLVD